MPKRKRPKDLNQLAKFIIKVDACSTVAPVLMFFKMAGSPDSNTTTRRRRPAFFIVLSVS
jgi:hypothetical protein